MIQVEMMVRRKMRGDRERKKIGIMKVAFERDEESW